MSINFNWFDDHRLVVISLKGEIGGQKVLEAYSSLCLDNRYYSKYHQLWDMRQISSLKYGYQDLRAFKLMVDIYCPPERTACQRRVAILAPQKTIFTTCCAALAFAGKKSTQRKVFRTFPAAKSWLSAVLDLGPLPH